MRSRNWICAVLVGLALACSPALAKDHDHDDDHGHGHGHDYDHGHGHDHDYDHEHGDHDRGHDEHYYRYSDHDHDQMRGWYKDHYRHLPPGLAKRDRLPPGLEQQIVVRGTLPPGLRGNIRPCPEEFVRRLPPPPPDCEHVFIGGRVVLLNRRNFMVVDVFNLSF